MAEREKVKPLATSCTRFNTDEDQAISNHLQFRRRKYIKCCGCVTALLLILVVTFLILSFTVFNLKEPEVRMNRVTLVNNVATLRNDANLTLVADVSVKNPNFFTFRFGNTTTILYYDGTGIGQGRTPPGKAKARRTLRLNVTVEIITDKLLGNASLTALNISSYTRMDGKVKILNLFNRKVVVEMNCTVEYNIASGSTHGENCLRRAIV